MALVPRQRKTKIVYYVTHELNGQPIWERVGTDKRKAELRDRAMKRELVAGTYVANRVTGQKTVGAWATTWLAARTTRTANDDRSRWRVHVLGRAKWFAQLKLEDVKIAHVVQLARQLYQPYTNHHGKLFTPAPKTITNVFKSVLGPMFRDARMADLMVRNVMELPRGTLITSSKRRRPYEAGVVTAMTTDERVRPDARMFAALAFYTGAREGELAGLRWHDWDRGPKPLGSLLIDSQYDEQPLKTGAMVGDNPRLVPVHPFLAAALAEWHDTGFEYVYGRRPTQRDFILPRFSDVTRCHDTSSGYALFQTALAKLGIPNQTLHATRNTFISLARRAGARMDVVEKITHNARGGIVDGYTLFDWLPLCEAVICFMGKQPEYTADGWRKAS